ncbi:MAG: hypothetical protein RR672_12160 [Raoultibacter sp.]
MAYYRTVLLNERRISCLEAEIERQQSRLSLNGVEGGEQVSKALSGDALEQGFVRLYDYCDAMDTELIGYVEQREAARRTLDSLTDGDMVQIVYLRYFEGLRFPAIHKLLTIGGSPMSERKMYSLHEQAMCILWRHIPEEYKQRRTHEA